MQFPGLLGQPVDKGRLLRFFLQVRCMTYSASIFRAEMPTAIAGGFFFFLLGSVHGRATPLAHWSSDGAHGVRDKRFAVWFERMPFVVMKLSHLSRWTASQGTVSPF